NLRISSKGQASSSNPKPRNADQICVYKEADGTRSLCMVVEYKPSHKLSVFNLRAGLLRADEGSMNIPEEVINRVTIPTDPEAKFVYHSEWLTAAALSQTYTYMIENGLKYSKLGTGEADVFLLIKEEEPHTLYYHLAEPNIEAEAQSEVDTVLCRTAVSQTLTFSLMALDSKPRNQKWRNHTLETACRAVIDHETILQQIPAEEKTLTPPPSVFHARIYPFERSPIMLRPRKLRKARNSCGSVNIIVHEDPQSPSGSSDETSDIETPSKQRAHTHQSNVGQVRPVRKSQAAEESDVCHRQYCTQACLLGLVRKRPLDDACPNVNAHRAHKTGNYHALEQKSLIKLMSRQLAENPDNGCEPLGKQGACGALFRLTLEWYGYTFVAKGTVTAFEAKLKHEGLVYQHLNEVQGELIPVYLGNISLVCPYFLDVGVRIVHMLLMSWAGEQARNDSMLAMGRDLATETNRAVTKMLDCGVEHRDVRPPNILWNSEGRKVILVDFERSEIFSVFHARIYPFERSPIMLRPRKLRKARNSCGSVNIIVHEDPQSPSGSSDETSDIETPSKQRAHTHQSNVGQVRPVRKSQAAEESDVCHRQYCTQACLLGLVRKRPLDDACPNVNAHRAHKTGNYHALEQKSLIKLMSRQLAENPDNGCEPLGKQGACGALFRLTLEWYGYTFVAKGTVTAFEAKLKHEGLVYQHLNEVQGELIPVYLGNISLVCPYFLDVGVRIVHMLLMSWAGEQARNDSMLAMGRDLATETNRAVTKMLDCGVEHRDVRPPNILWNSEGRKVILVDFERSEILKQMPILQEISPNRKRKHLYLADTASCSSQHHHQRFISAVT
ncbi:hypothetical protein HYALB_00013990, partial [Hymenoscyphus albidus]